MEATMLLSTQGAVGAMDYKISKSKPGRKLSQEPAKTKRNEQVRNAQRKYRAKNKFKLETLESENELLKKRVQALEEQLKVKDALLARAPLAPQSSDIITSSSTSSTIIDEPFDITKIADEISTDLSSDLFKQGVVQEPASVTADSASQTISDKFIDELFVCLKQDEQLQPPASISAPVTRSSSTDKFKFVYVHQDKSQSAAVSSIDLSSAAKGSSALQTHKFINTANCNSAVNNNYNSTGSSVSFNQGIQKPAPVITSGTSNIKIENFDDFIFNSISENSSHKDTSSIPFNEIISNIMRDAINIEDVFKTYNTSAANSNDLFEFFNSGSVPESQRRNQYNENQYNFDGNYNENENGKNEENDTNNDNGNNLNFDDILSNDINSNDNSNDDNDNNDDDNDSDISIGFHVSPLGHNICNPFIHAVGSQPNHHSSKTVHALHQLSSSLFAFGHLVKSSFPVLKVNNPVAPQSLESNTSRFSKPLVNNSDVSSINVPSLFASIPAHIRTLSS